MAVYSYIGLNTTGQELTGQIEAESEKEVALRLREQSVFLLKVRQGQGVSLDRSILTILRSALGLLNPARFMPVGSRDMVVFYRQLALMLRAGYTLASALDSSQDMQSKHRLRRAVSRIGDNIRRGESFSACLEKEKQLFPPTATNLIASGEQSGDLDAILERLADNIERGRELKMQFFTAMFYPSFVLLASLSVIVMVLIYVVPKFSAFLTARHAGLPGSMLLLMGISDWFLHWGKLLFAVTGITVFLILAAYTTRPGKMMVDRVLLMLPVIGNTIALSAMAQAGWNLSMLLRSGLTALEALKITGKGIGNLAVGACFTRAARGLLEGRSLSHMFNQHHIPPMVQKMAAVGESSGQLDAVMQEVGEYYQKELIARVKLMSAMIEPVMILSVGMIVFFVYLALFQSVMAVSKGGM